MHLKTRNVNTAFRELVTIMNGVYVPGVAASPTRPVRRSSRNGDVLMIDEPVIVTYARPTERVLFNAARDANPFFSLYESLWMLAGRNDLAPVAYYAKQMREYSDDGGTLNGAYGYRWRRGDHIFHDEEDRNKRGWCDFDQLNFLVAHLKDSPSSRRAVLAMWNVEDDLLKIGQKQLAFKEQDEPHLVSVEASKDVCCNLNVMFALRNVAVSPAHEEGGERTVLDMTVTNRSNDMIWGMLGANAVHFSFLQEYMAARLGVEVGVYNQITNNLHVYLSNWKPEEWLAAEPNLKPDGPVRKQVYEDGFMTMVPLIQDPAVFERELPLFVEWHQRDAMGTEWHEPFLNDVAQPLCVAFHHYKRNELQRALSVAETIAADDWCIAATNWIARRVERRTAKCNP